MPLEGAYDGALEGIAVVPLQPEVATSWLRATSRTTARVMSVEGEQYE